MVGAGNLGRAYIQDARGFRDQGFRIVALFDNDPAKIDTEIEGYRVFGLTDLPAQKSATMQNSP